MKSKSSTETQLALYPDTGNLLTCKCGVKFAPRINAQGDDPKKCSTCNRAGWSKLFRHVKSKISEVKVVPITRTRKERK